MEALEQLLLGETFTLEKVCSELASVFNVRCSEIGVLRLDGHVLTFLHPSELQVAGQIPLSSSAVVARTATAKKSELFNNFSNVPHHTVFELVRLTDPEVEKDPEHLRIQKPLSAPILGENNQLLGVVQVSRKGISPHAAGPDFTEGELQLLERAAHAIATLRPSLLLVAFKMPIGKLSLKNEQKKKPRAGKSWNLG